MKNNYTLLSTSLRLLNPAPFELYDVGNKVLFEVKEVDRSKIGYCFYLYKEQNKTHFRFVQEVPLDSTIALLKERFFHAKKIFSEQLASR